MKRYRIEDTHGWQHCPMESADGSWARYADAQAELQRYREALEQVCGSWVNGRNVLIGIPAEAAKLARALLDERKDTPQAAGEQP